MLPLTMYVQLTVDIIIGSVTDLSGAVVVGAHITLTNAGTGLETAPLHSTGSYKFEQVDPVTYALCVEAKGFSTAVT